MLLLCLAIVGGAALLGCQDSDGEVVRDLQVADGPGPGTDGPGPGTDGPGPDAGPGCGDGVKDGTEECDGSQLGGATCISMGYHGGTLKCSTSCTFDTSECYKCGDFVASGPEECDGSDFAGETCKSQGYDGGTLKCTGNCTLDKSGCYKCGDGAKNGSEPCDGSELGGETCASLGLGFDGGTLACKPDCSGFAVSGCSTAGFVHINKGSFTMGSPTNENCRGSDETEHPVTLSRDYEISAHEVTQAEFQAVMGYSPSDFAACGGDCPVEQVSWHEAAAYCNALSTQAGLSACYSCSGSGSSVTCQEASSYSGVQVYDCPGYRLPTEAEWEHAYRAGSNTALYPSAGNSGSITNCSGTLDSNTDKIGWHEENSSNTTHPKGQKAANAWALYDMAGNVWEWCHDRYQSDLGTSAVTDPWGAASETDRVLRGGAWGSDAGFLRAARRLHLLPSFPGNLSGFRPCRTMN